jgi:Holliday junction resolvasome RuvABC endonuclease subunit
MPMVPSAEASTATRVLPARHLCLTSLPPSILCLDLGSRTGWALHDDGATFSGSISFKTGRYEGGGMRYLRFRQWLVDLLSNTRRSKAAYGSPAVAVDAVYFEEVRAHAGTDAAHIYGGFLAVLSACCEDQAIAYLGVPVGTIKRHITGKGNADKATVTAAVRARGFDPADDNEADAIAILLWAIETQGGVR